MSITDELWEQVTNERDAAHERIAELEAELATLRADVVALDLERPLAAESRIAELEELLRLSNIACNRTADYRDKALERIAQAAAELEKLRADFSRNALSDGIDSALAILKGTRT